MSRQELAEKLHKPIIRKFEKQKVQSSFIDNIWDAELSNVQLVSKSDEGICFILCVNDILSKNAWIVPLKDKKVLQLLRLFRKS